jgi:cell division septum initiation protein DivIVA
LSSTASPKGYETIVNKINKLKQEIETLKSKLNNKDLVNSYINENYPESKYNFD